MLPRIQDTILAVAVLSFSLNFRSVSASNALQVIPELQGKGAVEVVYLNPDSHKISHEKIDENGNVKVALSKRGGYGTLPNDDNIVTLLRHNNGAAFCKGYCPNYNPSTVTKIDLKTATQIVKVTSTICAGGNCAPAVSTVTVTASSPQDVTTVQTSTASTTSTNIISAEPTTTTILESSTVTALSTTTTTSTSTVAIPSAVVARGANVPSWLKNVKTSLICGACNKVYPTPTTRTVFVSRTTTVSKTQTQTATKARSTKISTITIKPSAKLVTQVVTTTLSFTESSTVTPTITTTSAVLFTTTSVTTSTATATICAQQIGGLGGISIMPLGSLSVVSAADIPACCTACFNTPGCNAWIFFGVNDCLLATDCSPRSGSATAACPNGKGDAGLFQSNEGGLIGGPGQCALNGPTML